jgi:hypothetical protein
MSSGLSLLMCLERSHLPDIGCFAEGSPLRRSIKSAFKQAPELVVHLPSLIAV